MLCKVLAHCAFIATVVKASVGAGVGMGVATIVIATEGMTAVSCGCCGRSGGIFTTTGAIVVKICGRGGFTR